MDEHWSIFGRVLYRMAILILMVVMGWLVADLIRHIHDVLPKIEDAAVEFKLYMHHKSHHLKETPE